MGLRRVAQVGGVSAGAAGFLLAASLPAAAASPPVAVPDSYRVVQGKTLTLGPAAGLLRNDRDADGAALFVQQLSSLRVGRVTVARNGSFTYRAPNSATARYDYFTYRTCEVARPAVCSAAVPVEFFLVPAGGRPTGVNDRYVAT